MSRFGYRIYDNVYKEMISGRKNIEFRLLNEKSEKIKIGDEILFTVVSNENNNILVEVTNKYIYENIDELWDSGDTKNNILNYNKNELIKVFYNIYGKDKVINSKIVGIEFKMKK